MNYINTTKIIINDSHDISSLVEYWYIYMQPGGIGIILRGSNILSYNFENIYSITIKNKTQILKIDSKQKNTAISSNSDDIIEIWVTGGVLS